MKKIKGLVLESNRQHVSLLTPEGDYLKVPFRGKVFETGAEIEIEYPQAGRRSWLLALAASIVLIFAFSYLLYPALNRPEAYLALDINPSLYLSLNRDGRVIEAEALNQEAVELLSQLKLKGKNIPEALTLILDDAFAGNYLSAEKDNVILISLAAPESYVINKEELELAVSEKILNMEVNTYLKVTTLDLQKAVEAREHNISVNSMVLGERMAEKGYIMGEEDLQKKGTGPPPAVREFLSQVRPEEVFEPENFIQGKPPEGKRPEHAVGPPGAIPPGQVKKGPAPEPAEKEIAPTGKEKEKDTPPGLEKNRIIPLCLQEKLHR